MAKVGGLADVAGSLPKALVRLGHDVRVVIPCYKETGGGSYLTDLPVRMDGNLETCIVRGQGLLYGANGRWVPVYLVDNHRYFYREGIYAHSDDAARFDFFCKAVLAMLPALGFCPDVIHCNDWQTGPLPLYLKTKHREDPFYSDIATLFTIHNLQYQGRFPRATLRVMGLPEEYFHPDGVEFHGDVNFMKAGLVWADIINTVSRRYAVEIQTPQFGEGLDGLLRKRGSDLFGIVNGIDMEEFNPASDRHIPFPYDGDRLDGKANNKRFLQQEMDLPQREVPLFGLVSRLVYQKGLDLVEAVLPRLMEEDVQFVLLGTGEDYHQQLFSNLRLKYRGRMGVRIGFDIGLAQRIYAGSDLFLMPSRFEPCGLGQLISLRYGTIPIVRSTGGLEDTVTDYRQDPARGNGFSFGPYSPDHFWQAIQAALALYRDNPAKWQGLVRRAMAGNYGWDTPAAKYVDLYLRALAKKPAETRQAV